MRVPMTAAEHKQEHRRLQKLTHRNLIRLIDSELSLARTMSQLAETESELGHRTHAKTLLAKAKEAVDTVRRHMGNDELSDEETRSIQQRLQELMKRQDAAKSRVLDGRKRTGRKAAKVASSLL